MKVTTLAVYLGFLMFNSNTGISLGSLQDTSSVTDWFRTNFQGQDFEEKERRNNISETTTDALQLQSTKSCSKLLNATKEKYQSDIQTLQEIYEDLIYIQDLFILPPVCSIGIVGNGIVAKVLYGKSGTNSSFIYMLAVLVCDTFSLVSDLFLTIATILNMVNSDMWKQTASNLYFWNRNFVSYILRNTAFNILCVLSFERLTAIKYPFKLKSSWTVKHPNIFLVLSFLIGSASVLSVPLYTKITGKFNAESNSSVYKRTYTDLFLNNVVLHDKIIVGLRFFAGPLQIFFFCIMNGLILHGLYRNKKQLFTIESRNVTHVQRAKRLQIKLCKIFLVLCISNILAFLPNSFTIILGKLAPQLGLKLQSPIVLIYQHGGNFLRVINSASDFIVMIALSTEMRNDVKERMFKCFRHTRNRP